MSEITEHTPLEVLLNDSIMKHFDFAFVENCRAELAALRAIASELQAARAEAGVIDGVPLVEWLREEMEAHYYCKIARDDYTNKAARVTTLEAALYEIVELGKDSHTAFDGERWRGMWRAACAALESWRLAANAPARETPLEAENAKEETILFDDPISDEDVEFLEAGQEYEAREFFGVKRKRGRKTAAPEAGQGDGAA